MPWSFKGAELLVRQYAPVGAAAEVSLRAALELIARTARPELVSFGQALAARAAAVEDYRDTYRCAESMNASSASWRSKQSRSTRDYEHDSDFSVVIPSARSASGKVSRQSICA
jgi:hypothetical protein